MAGAAEHSALAGAILKGTATNYLRVAVKLVKTVMLTRILQYHLGVDFYGYWTLLWAVFGYAMLLELGFGRTMQKYTAEGVDTPERLLSFNRIFSAVLASYLGIALALLAISALLAVNLESIFRRAIPVTTAPCSGCSESAARWFSLPASAPRSWPACTKSTGGTG